MVGKLVMVVGALLLALPSAAQAGHTACTEVGDPCTDDPQCCQEEFGPGSRTCFDGECCISTGFGLCTADDQCCQTPGPRYCGQQDGICNNCRPQGDTCGAPAECCSTDCFNGTCVTCRPEGAACGGPDDRRKSAHCSSCRCLSANLCATCNPGCSSIFTCL